MVPKGNMMQSLLEVMEGEKLKMVDFKMSNRAVPPLEIIGLECELADFFSSGLTNVNRAGKLTINTDISITCKI